MQQLSSRRPPRDLFGFVGTAKAAKPEDGVEAGSSSSRRHTTSFKLRSTSTVASLSRLRCSWSTLLRLAAERASSTDENTPCPSIAIHLKVSFSASTTRSLAIASLISSSVTTTEESALAVVEGVFVV